MFIANSSEISHSAAKPWLISRKVCYELTAVTEMSVLRGLVHPSVLRVCVGGAVRGQHAALLSAFSLSTDWLASLPLQVASLLTCPRSGHFKGMMILHVGKLYQFHVNLDSTKTLKL